MDQSESRHSCAGRNKIRSLQRTPPNRQTQLNLLGALVEHLSTTTKCYQHEKQQVET